MPRYRPRLLQLSLLTVIPVPALLPIRRPSAQTSHGVMSNRSRSYTAFFPRHAKETPSAILCSKTIVRLFGLFHSPAAALLGDLIGLPLSPSVSGRLPLVQRDARCSPGFGFSQHQKTSANLGRTSRFAQWRGELPNDRV